MSGQTSKPIPRLAPTTATRLLLSDTAIHWTVALLPARLLGPILCIRMRTEEGLQCASHPGHDLHFSRHSQQLHVSLNHQYLGQKWGSAPDLSSYC